jgi:hypothetical protein
LCIELVTVDGTRKVADMIFCNFQQVWLSFASFGLKIEALKKNLREMRAISS